MPSDISHCVAVRASCLQAAAIEETITEEIVVSDSSLCSGAWRRADEGDDSTQDSWHIDRDGARCQRCARLCVPRAVLSGCYLRSLLPDRVVAQRWGASFYYKRRWGFHDHLWTMWEAGLLAEGSRVALAPSARAVLQCHLRCPPGMCWERRPRKRGGDVVVGMGAEAAFPPCRARAPRTIRVPGRH